MTRCRARLLPLLVAALALRAGTAVAGDLIDRLLSEYGRVESVTCQVRRRTESAEGVIRMLSRVHFKRPDRLHVESITGGIGGTKRRIVADGTRLYMHIEGRPKGFSRPVDALDPAMLVELRRLPGTAMDHLLRLQGTPSESLPPEDGYPVRRFYRKPGLKVVISLDDMNRPAQIVFYRDANRAEPLARYTYSAFQEVVEGVWIPMLHEAKYREGGLAVTESLRISHYAANLPVPDGLFDADAFFADVRFDSE